MKLFIAVDIELLLRMLIDPFQQHLLANAWLYLHSFPVVNVLMKTATIVISDWYLVMNSGILIIVALW